MSVGDILLKEPHLGTRDLFRNWVHFHHRNHGLNRAVGYFFSPQKVPVWGGVLFNGPRTLPVPRAKSCSMIVLNNSQWLCARSVLFHWLHVFSSNTRLFTSRRHLCFDRDVEMRECDQWINIFSVIDLEDYF